jgi:riboflavin kinase / FMN adenylyltransferase
MQVYQSFAEVDSPRAAVCTVGTFDGVHLGHQQLLRALVDDAHTRGVPAAVVTFFPHPRVVLGRAPALYLTLPDEKAHQLELLGVDILVVLTFDPQTIQTTAAEFMRHMIEHLRMVSLWIGPDFALGKGRQGDNAFLRALGSDSGFAVNTLSPVSAGIESVSSTRIRTALARGDMREVRLCLGRPYELTCTLLDERTIRPPAQRALPAVGEYAALVCGELNHVRIQDTDAGVLLHLTSPARCDNLVHNQITIAFAV